MQLKKFCAVLLAMMLIVSCLACGNDSGNSKSESSAAGSTSKRKREMRARRRILRIPMRQKILLIRWTVR